MKICISFVIALFACVFFSFGQETLTPELLWKLNRLSGGKVSPDGKKVLYQLTTYNMEANTGNTDLYVLDLATGTSTQITDTPTHEMGASWGKNNRIWFLSVSTGSTQLFSMNDAGKEIKQHSDFKNQDISGYKLSPDETKIAIISSVKVKQTLKEKYSDLPKANARLEDDLMYRHWNYWNDEHVNHIFVYRFSAENGTISKNGTDILNGEIFHGVTPPFSGSEQISFSTDGNTVFYSTKKLTGKAFATSTNTEIYAYNIDSKKTTLLSDGFLGYDNHPTALRKSNQLAWLSMARNGFESDKNDLIVKDLTTGTTQNLTAKFDYTIDDFLFAADEKIVYLLIPTQGTKQVFSLTLKSGELKQLTTGVFDVVSMDLVGSQLILGRQSMIEPTDLYQFDLKKSTFKQLTACNENWLKNIQLPEVTQRWVETTDGKKMLVWVILPPNMDKAKKHPALLYCQGGPQSMVSQFFSYRWNLALMASQGYVVVAPNRRGLPGFGQAWNDEISKDWGGQSIRDYLSAIDDVSKESFVDATRLGAVGASYGGYSVYFLAGKHEGRFKTFISHCGLFNLESWYGTTEELFFANWDNRGPYWNPENKEYYKQNSPHNFVQNWDTPILVIHGGMDFRVPESEGMQAFQAAQLLGLKSNYLLFPTEGHWVTKPQNGLLWQREFFAWLENDLKK